MTIPATDERTLAARPVRPPWTGLLSIDKPAGVTSHDVVDKVRRRMRVARAGHLGTLDPGASGLLVVALGAATRCTAVWQGGEKTYEGSLRLGVVTRTQDLSGEVLETREVLVGEREVREASTSLVGLIEQIPPMMSALKVGGERLYRLARRGVEVERRPREVRVSAWEWLGFDLPSARFRIRCSSGTYIRTLAHDLGTRLGTGAALESLRRLRSEPFALTRAVTWRDLSDLTPPELWAQAGTPLEAALSVLPALRLEPEEADALGFGAPIRLDAERARNLPVVGGVRSVVFLAHDGEPLALGEIETDPAGPDRIARPHLVFPWGVRVGRPN